MSVCLLSAEEVGRLRNYDIKPTCHKMHRHIPVAKAAEQVSIGLLELIVDGDEQYVTQPPLHYLKVKGINVQRVRSNQPKFVTPADQLELPTWEQERILK